MSHINQLLYFISQSYRQVQLSVETGVQLYPYSEFSTQVTTLLTASGNEAYTRQLTVELVEEAAQCKQTTDYLRQELAFEIKVAAVGDRAMTLQPDATSPTDCDLYTRRLSRHTDHSNQLVAELP